MPLDLRTDEEVMDSIRARHKRMYGVVPDNPGIDNQPHLDSIKSNNRKFIIGAVVLFAGVVALISALVSAGIIWWWIG